MYLLADIGNYRIKWALADKRADIVHTFSTKTSAGVSSMRKICVDCHDRGRLTAVIVASVVPEANARLKDWAAESFPEVPVCDLDFAAFSRVMTMKVTPVVIPPGADRLANAFALAAGHRLPACAVDAGSAVTLEVVNDAGIFIGGSIRPGERMQLVSLQLNTSRLGQIAKLPRTFPAIGTHTAEAIASGVRRGNAWAVYGLVQDMQEELGQPFQTVVVTGGDGRRLVPFLKKRMPGVVYEKELTLRGMLAAYLALNQSGKDK